jgi:hypothetical protein
MRQWSIEDSEFMGIALKLDLPVLELQALREIEAQSNLKTQI